MHTKEEKMEAFGRLLDIMDDLRSKCPWDKKQTFQSLRILTIEETYELVDAIIKNDLEEVEEEIGDLLLHMVFYAKIGSETEQFDIKTSLDRVCDKLIKRHPHIYSDVTVKDDEEVKQNWEKLKLKHGKKSVLGGVPNGLPALIKAYRMQEKTAQVGFEWDEKSQVWSKVQEELDELREAVDTGLGKEKVEEEYGDLLFALVNYARFEHIDPERALELCNLKFKRRFEYIEKQAPKSLTDMTLTEMDALWNEAKGKEE
jgi:XTP/dITP diphosphohydrolase